MNDFTANSKEITQSEGSKIITTSKNENETFFLTEESLDLIRYIALVDSKSPNDVLNDIIVTEFVRTVLKPDPTMSNNHSIKKE